MEPQIPNDVIQKLKSALDALDSDMVDVDGVKLKPSQCYHFGANPAHILFNTNCPDLLKKRLQEIIQQYMPGNEGSPQQQN